MTGVINEWKPEVILHLAARTDLESQSVADYAANVDGVRNLVDAVGSSDSVRRCVITSSQLVCRPGYVPRDEYDTGPHTAYGESKVLTERIVRETDCGGKEWCIVRPTTVWGPGMSPHYQRFFRMIARGLYVHVGERERYKSYGYVGNIVHQYRMLVEAPTNRIERRTIYLADYEPMGLRGWADEIQRQLGAPKIRTIPERMARLVASGGDILNWLGWRSFPLNSFRLNNVLVEYRFDLGETREICGPLPFAMPDGVRQLVKWIRAGMSSR